jgi:exopolyphosphatase/pppGpp-phosphohydrolase
LRPRVPDRADIFIKGHAALEKVFSLVLKAEASAQVSVFVARTGDLVDMLDVAVIVV